MWQEKDEQLAKEFNQLVGESSSFYPALLRVFKVRREERRVVCALCGTWCGARGSLAAPSTAPLTASYIMDLRTRAWFLFLLLPPSTPPSSFFLACLERLELNASS